MAGPGLDCRSRGERGAARDRAIEIFKRAAGEDRGADRGTARPDFENATARDSRAADHPARQDLEEAAARHFCVGFGTEHDLDAATGYDCAACVAAGVYLFGAAAADADKVGSAAGLDF